MTRHRRPRTWTWRKRPTVAPEADAVTEPQQLADVDQIVKATRHAEAIFDRGVAGTRRHYEPQPDRAHRDRHGPFMDPRAVCPPPPMGGVR